ncbi:hypothetical protein [Pseudomonas cremoricolorata]|uniref:Uncharacterized protein n=1 Tax=Pseudomonas cremoricolorata TaxID=157783 RepID=A0A089WKN0_9PSED|nr:hypothetical protein [Pseudomonas cremoricolorata]AIR89885.1 hypothetical protein LK03_11550 [Pseudomonas cremoricolorata]
MTRTTAVLSVILALGLLLAASYGVRYGLMEDARWVGLCSTVDAQWQCQARSWLGLTIHFQTLAWLALGSAVLAQMVKGRSGRALGGLALLLGIPALVLYTASLAVFAVVLGGLRVVRAQG